MSLQPQYVRLPGGKLPVFVRPLVERPTTESPSYFTQAVNAFTSLPAKLQLGIYSFSFAVCMAILAQTLGYMVKGKFHVGVIIFVIINFLLATMLNIEQRFVLTVSILILLLSYFAYIVMESQAKNAELLGERADKYWTTYCDTYVDASGCPDSLEMNAEGVEKLMTIAGIRLWEGTDLNEMTPVNDGDLISVLRGIPGRQLLTNISVPELEMTVKNVPTGLDGENANYIVSRGGKDEEMSPKKLISLMDNEDITTMKCTLRIGTEPLSDGNCDYNTLDVLDMMLLDEKRMRKAPQVSRTESMELLFNTNTFHKDNLVTKEGFRNWYIEVLELKEYRDRPKAVFTGNRGVNWF